MPLSLLRRLSLHVLFLVLATFGTVLSVSSLGRETYRWRGLEIELRLLPVRHGDTELVLKPLGEIHAKTHHAPVRLIASLERIEVDELKKLVTVKTDTTKLEEEFKTTAESTLRAFVLRQLAFAALGALLAPLLFRSLRVRHYLFAAVFGAGIVGSALGNAVSTFDRQAFSNVTYTGALKQAPWVIQFGRDAFTKFDALSSKLRLVADNLNVLYGRIAAVQDNVGETGGTTFRVLHISDIHNNTAAFDFVRKVADQFKVELIVDTGDLTDFGSPPELVIVNKIGKLPYRYVFVAGNHDSKAVTNALTELPNVVVLNGQTVKVGELRLLGLPNPASLREGAGNVDPDPAGTVANAAQLLKAYEESPENLRPDAVVTHDPRETVSLWGKIPVALVGHMHRQYVEQQPSSNAQNNASRITIVSNAGTTGAAGLRYFEGQGGKQAFTCSVLTFLKPTITSTNTSGAVSLRPKLIAVDLIQLDGGLNQYSITHQTL